MCSPTSWHLGLTMLLLATATARGVDPVTDSYYFDEVTMRHLHLRQTGLGKTEVDVRFAGDPGSANRWIGEGQRKDKELTFARKVGEGEDRGTYFIADVSESKAVIRYKPNQSKTEDAGILGTYHRTTDGKRMQLARKEFQAATDRLVASLKTAPKAWDSRDKPALALWKDQWAAMRQRWMDVNFALPAASKAAAPKGPLAPKEAPAAAADKLPDYWFKMAEATAHGYYFVETHPDPKTRTDWDGEYDDFAGGHASLRQQKDGKLRLALTFARAPDDTATGEMEVTTSAEKVGKSKDGSLTADFTYVVVNVDPEASAEVAAKAKAEAEAHPASVHLTKIGRYLKVETEHAELYAKRGWFDGVYRGSPPPAE